MSFGIWLSHTDITLADGTKLNFISNRIRYFKLVDERNLIYCKQLNLCYSSITSIETSCLINLEVLYLCESAIDTIDLRCLPKLKEVFGCHSRNRIVLTKPGVIRHYCDK